MIINEFIYQVLGLKQNLFINPRYAQTTNLLLFNQTVKINILSSSFRQYIFLKHSAIAQKILSLQVTQSLSLKQSAVKTANPLGIFQNLFFYHFASSNKPEQFLLFNQTVSFQLTKSIQDILSLRQSVDFVIEHNPTFNQSLNFNSVAYAYKFSPKFISQVIENPPVGGISCN